MDYQIRHIEAGDEVAYQRIANQPSVYAGTLNEPYAPLERFAKRIGEVPNGGRCFVATANGEVVGIASIFVQIRPRRRHVGAIGMMVDEAWQGRGVGSVLMQALVDHADNWLNLRRIELEVFTDNAGGIRLYEKFGFEIEGKLRDWAYRDGQYVDAYYMARLR